VSLQNKLAVTVSTASTHVGGHTDTTRGARTSLRNTGCLTKNWRDELSLAHVQNVCADSWGELVGVRQCGIPTPFYGLSW
jgi:hypothetical protein